MSKYNGVKCVHCHKEFANDDRVVVCPTCGAPHHRECYDEIGHCGEEHLHGSEGAYFVKEEERRKRINQQRTGAACEGCGAAMYVEDTQCSQCGKEVIRDKQVPVGSVFASQSTSPPLTGDPVDGVTEKELATYIGFSSKYFILRFRAMANNQRVPQVNLAAFLLGFIYFFYRKMYKVAIGLFVVFFICSIPSMLIANELAKDLVIETVTSGEMMGGVDMSALQNIVDVSTLTPTDYDKVESLENIGFYLNIVYMIATVIGSIYANKLYYNQCLTEIRNTRAGYGGVDENRYYYALARKGRTTIATPLLVVIIYSMIGFIFNYITVSSMLGM